MEAKWIGEILQKFNLGLRNNIGTSAFGDICFVMATVEAKFCV